MYKWAQGEIWALDFYIACKGRPSQAKKVSAAFSGGNVSVPILVMSKQC